MCPQPERDEIQWRMLRISRLGNEHMHDTGVSPDMMEPFQRVEGQLVRAEYLGSDVCGHESGQDKRGPGFVFPVELLVQIVETEEEPAAQQEDEEGRYPAWPRRNVTLIFTGHSVGPSVVRDA